MTAPKKLTAKDAERALDIWIDRLNLVGWQIEIDWTHDIEPGNDAEISIPKDYDVAKMAFEGGWPYWDRIKLSEVIVHELMHIHLHHIQNAGLSCGDFMGKEARNLYHMRFTHELEKTVDGLAVALVTAMGPA